MASYTPQEIVEGARNLAQRSGASEAEAYLEVVNVQEARVRQGETEFLFQSAVQGLGVRVFINRKVGFSYTTDIRRSTVDELVRRAIVLAGQNSARDENRLPDEQLPALPDLDLYDAAIASMKTTDLVDLARKTEDQTFASDKRIQSTRNARAITTASQVYFANTYVPYQTYQTTSISLGVTAVATDGTMKREGHYADTRRIYADLFQPERIGRRAADRAIAKLGAKPIPTTQAPVIFEADAAAAFLASILPAFSGTNAIEGRSFIVGHINKPVASPLLTLMDDGLLRRGLGTRPFDGEGVQQRQTVVIDRGVLTKILHTSTTARKRGVRLTGNAMRTYDRIPAVGATNLYIVAGDTALDKMVSDTPRGLLVTDLAGFGVDTVTGEFSEQVSGRWIEKGVLGAAVEGVAVAGRIGDMLMGIDAVGKDLLYRSTICSPSLRFKQLTIAGT